jgi:two-component system OmpR family sensor kinase
MNPLRSGLYRRLLLWFCAANVVTLLATVFITERLARDAYVNVPNWSQLADGADRAWIAGGPAALREWIEAQREDGVDAALFEGTRNLADVRPPVPRVLLPQLLASADDMEMRPHPEHVVAVQRVTGSDGVERRLIAAKGHHPPRHRLPQMLGIHIALSLAAIGLVGWWLARSLARPMTAIGAAARRVAGGDLAARVGPQHSGGADEVGELARDFDRMAARIETLVAGERSVLQDVSHELRSPLARLHLVLDLARRSPPEEAAAHFARAEREIARLDRLIEEALALSRMESDLPGATREPVDVAELARQRVAEHRIEADPRRVTLDVDAPAAVMVHGNAVLLARALDNLLSNAIKFSVEGGRVEVGVHVDAGDAVLTIRDHGPGAGDEDLPRLFRPFFRGANSEGVEGHGLGLAIVERVARAHGGRVSAANAEGGGLRVTLSLPRAG